MLELPPDSVLNYHSWTRMSLDPRGLIQSSLLSLMNSVDLELITSNSVIMAHIVLSGE